MLYHVHGGGNCCNKKHEMIQRNTSRETFQLNGEMLGKLLEKELLFCLITQMLDAKTILKLIKTSKQFHNKITSGENQLKHLNQEFLKIPYFRPILSHFNHFCECSVFGTETNDNI